MSKHVNWSGVFPAVTTQFNSDFSVNLEETHKVISNLVRDGVSGLVVCGSVGENTSLTIEEKMAVTEVAKDASGGRVPVICGIAEFTSAGTANRAASSFATGSHSNSLSVARDARTAPSSCVGAQYSSMSCAVTLPGSP